MNQHRKAVNKIYNRIENIIRKGPNSMYEYYTYIDSLVRNGMYGILEDVMISKYDIDMIVYISVDDFKKKSFPEIMTLSVSRFQKKLAILLSKNGIYTIGTHYYNATTNTYLGDILEIEQPAIFRYYEDNELKNQNKIINLEVIKGVNSTAVESTPVFDIKKNDTITFATQSVVYYLENFYRCIQMYSWNSNNMILPTNPSYWAIYDIGTYSYTLISDDNMALFDKYSLAISLLQ